MLRARMPFLAVVLGLLVAAAPAAANTPQGNICQVAGSFLFETGFKKVLNLDVIDWALAYLKPPKNRADQIRKGLLYMTVGSKLIATCPPLFVPPEFMEMDGSERLAFAREHGWLPHGSVNGNFDVDDPEDPTSCVATLATTFDDDTGLMTNFGDLPEARLVYVQPFGAFPSALGQLADASLALRNTLVSMLNAIEGPDLGLETPSDLQDFAADLGGPLGTDRLNSQVQDVVLDFLGSGLDLQSRVGAQFSSWTSNLPERAAAGVITGSQGAWAFRDGRTELEFDSGVELFDFEPGSETIKFDQEIRVTEYFAPVFPILSVEENPETEQMVEVTAVLVYEALEPGRANRSYTPPSSVTGSLVPTDNCDPKPEVDLLLPVLIEIGTHYFPIDAVDRSGNQADRAWVKVIVQDTLPPDLNPPQAIGIEVPAGTAAVAFTDPGVGCEDYLCQLSTTAVLFPPPFFDFATASPSYQCEVTSSLGVDVPCTSASLPAGEQSTVTWTVIDGVGLATVITQSVAVREAGTNTGPVATPTTVTIHQGTTVEIPFVASDAEHDVIQYAVTSPDHGGLGVQLEPVFQTRVTLAGTIPTFTSLLSEEIDVDQQARWVAADPVNGRLVELVPGFDDPVTEVSFLPYQPWSITFDREEHRAASTFQQNLQDMVIADWSTGRVYGMGTADPHDDSTYVDVSSFVRDPKNISYRGDLSPPALLIADADPATTDGGRLVVLRSNAAGDAVSAGPWFKNLGFNPDGLSFDAGWGGQNRYIVTNWDAQRIVQWETDIGDAGDGSLIRQWDVSVLFGAGTAGRVGDPHDIVVREFGNLAVFIADDRDKEVDQIDLAFDQTVGGTSNEAELATQFVDVRSIVSTPTGFLSLEGHRITGFDLFGIMQSLILTQSGGSSGGGSFPRLIPVGQTDWIDIDVADDGDLLLVEEGNGVDVVQVLRIEVNPGFADWTEVSDGTHGERALALAFSPGPTSATTDDRVYVVLQDGLLRYQAEDLSQATTLLLNSGGCVGPWCATELPFNLTAIASDAQGNVFISDADHRVHKVADDGTYVGWMGACSGGDGCTSQSGDGRSTGFSCSASTCTGPGTRGQGQGMFDFTGVCPGLFSAEHGYGRLHVDRATETLYVTDLPVTGADYGNLPSPDCFNDPPLDEISVPRVQAFTDQGVFLNESLPGQAENLLGFLEPGGFVGIDDLTTDDDIAVVAEGGPLKRLHVLDTAQVSATLEGGTVTYAPDPGFVGTDAFEVRPSDPFEPGAPGLVTVEVIDDTTPPTLACPADLEVEATGPGGAAAQVATAGTGGSLELASFLGAASATDDVTLPPVEVSHDAPAVFALGSTEVTFTALDGAGLTSTCARTVTVVDTTPPELVVGDDVVAEATAPLTPVMLTAPAVTELVGLQSLTSDAPEPGYPVGVTTVRWVALDTAGNRAEALQRVTVTDTTAPQLNVAAPVVTRVASTGYSNPASYDLPTLTDATATEVRCSPAPGRTVPGGAVEISCLAIDDGNQIAAISFTLDIVQEDADGDGLVDIVDDDDATASSAWNDQEGSFGARLEGSGRVEDAFRQPVGVRVLGSGVAGEADHVTGACGDVTLRVPAVASVADEEVPGEATATCVPTTIEAVAGTAVVEVSTFDGGVEIIELAPGEVYVREDASGPAEPPLGCSCDGTGHRTGTDGGGLPAAALAVFALVGLCRRRRGVNRTLASTRRR